MSAKRDGTDPIIFLNGIAHGVANLKCVTVPGPRFLSGSRAPKSTRPLFAASEPYEDLSFSSNR